MALLFKTKLHVNHVEYIMPNHLRSKRAPTNYKNGDIIGLLYSSDHIGEAKHERKSRQGKRADYNKKESYIKGTSHSEKASFGKGTGYVSPSENTKYGSGGRHVGKATYYKEATYHPIRYLPYGKNTGYGKKVRDKKKALYDARNTKPSHELGYVWKDTYGEKLGKKARFMKKVSRGKGATHGGTVRFGKASYFKGFNYGKKASREKRISLVKRQVNLASLSEIVNFDDGATYGKKKGHYKNVNYNSKVSAETARYRTEVSHNEKSRYDQETSIIRTAGQGRKDTYSGKKNSSYGKENGYSKKSNFVKRPSHIGNNPHGEGHHHHRGHTHSSMTGSGKRPSKNKGFIYSHKGSNNKGGKHDSKKVQGTGASQGNKLNSGKKTSNGKKINDNKKASPVKEVKGDKKDSIKESGLGTKPSQGKEDSGKEDNHRNIVIDRGKENKTKENENSGGAGQGEVNQDKAAHTDNNLEVKDIPNSQTALKVNQWTKYAVYVRYQEGQTSSIKIDSVSDDKESSHGKEIGDQVMVKGKNENKFNKVTRVEETHPNGGAVQSASSPVSQGGVVKNVSGEILGDSTKRPVDPKVTQWTKNAIFVRENKEEESVLKENPVMENQPGVVTK